MKSLNQGCHTGCYFMDADEITCKVVQKRVSYIKI